MDVRQQAIEAQSRWKISPHLALNMARMIEMGADVLKEFGRPQQQDDFFVWLKNMVESEAAKRREIRVQRVVDKLNESFEDFGFGTGQK